MHKNRSINDQLIDKMVIKAIPIIYPNGLNADILSKVHRALGNKKTINNVHSRTTRRTR